MKKLLFILIAMFFALQATSQEFLKVEDVTYVKSNTKPGGQGVYPRVILSNGFVLNPYYHHAFSYEVQTPRGKSWGIRTNLTKGMRLKQGDLIYHTGDYYWYEPKKFQKQVVIKTINIRKIKGAYSGSIQGDFGYKSFLAFVSGLGGGGGSAEGSLSGSFQGGAYTVANVTFTDGSHASILMTQDGFWYEVKPGEKINVYKLRDANIYEIP